MINVICTAYNFQLQQQNVYIEMSKSTIMDWRMIIYNPYTIACIIVIAALIIIIWAIFLY